MTGRFQLTYQQGILAVDAQRRFWLRVDKSAGPSACHPWTGSVDKDGYGLWSPSKHSTVRVHRLALELKLGRPLTRGEEARHVNGCQSRACCNQRHLKPGSHRENIADREAAGTTQKGSRHWKARLSEAQVAAVKGRLSAGETSTAIAADLGVGRRCISHIATGKNWKNVVAALAADRMSLRRARAFFGVAELMAVAS